MLRTLFALASALLLRLTRAAVLQDRKLNSHGIRNVADSSISDSNPTEKNLRFRVIVLNLNSRPQRLQRFAQNLYQHPDVFAKTCRLPAVDASDAFVLGHIYQQGIVQTKSKLKDGMIGCYMSHWTALRMIASDTSIDFGIVMEDDLVHYSPDFDAEIANLWNRNAASIWQRTDWVYLQMDGSGWFKGQNRSTDATQFQDMRGLWPKNTAMYAVSRAGAAQLAGTTQSSNHGSLLPIRLELDEALPPLLTRKWAFVPPIAQALHKDEPGGDTNVQFLQKQVPPIHDCPAV